MRARELRQHEEALGFPPQEPTEEILDEGLRRRPNRPEAERKQVRCLELLRRQGPRGCSEAC